MFSLIAGLLLFRLLEKVDNVNTENRLQRRPKRTTVKNDLVGIYATYEQVFRQPFYIFYLTYQIARK